MAFEIIAVVTNEGKRRMAQAIATAKCFAVNTFAVSSFGHDPANPTLALSPDPAQLECVPGGVPLFGPEPIDSYTYVGTHCPEFSCTVEEGEAVGVISSVCLLGTIQCSPIPLDPELGLSFLFAVANMPYWAKTDQDSRTWKITIRF